MGFCPLQGKSSVNLSVIRNHGIPNTLIIRASSCITTSQPLFVDEKIDFIS